MNEPHLAAAGLPQPVTGDSNEIYLQRHVQFADEVGQEDESALQDAYKKGTLTCVVLSYALRQAPDGIPDLSTRKDALHSRSGVPLPQLLYPTMTPLRETCEWQVPIGPIGPIANPLPG